MFERHGGESCSLEKRLDDLNFSADYISLLRETRFALSLSADLTARARNV